MTPERKTEEIIYLKRIKEKVLNEKEKQKNSSLNKYANFCKEYALKAHNTSNVNVLEIVMKTNVFFIGILRKYVFSPVLVANVLNCSESTVRQYVNFKRRMPTIKLEKFINFLLKEYL